MLYFDKDFCVHRFYFDFISFYVDLRTLGDGWNLLNFCQGIPFKGGMAGQPWGRLASRSPLTTLGNPKCIWIVFEIWVSVTP